MDVVGEVERIDGIVQCTPRFRKRDLYLLIGGTYPEIVKFQVVQDQCESLDVLHTGDVIKVYFNLKGKFYTNKDGNEYHFNNIQCWKFEIVNEDGTKVEVDYSDPEDDDLPF